jgi:D-alanyl-D-alanine carboxypeptidase (penicillin-binding protein 5/6)
MKHLLSLALVLGLLSAGTAAAAVQTLSRDPYLSAIVVDAASGKVIFEDNADAVGYPASVLKLMDLLIILEKVQQGVLKLEDRVKVTAEASKIGGSQVYLAEKEEFSIDELLYALMIQSANDAATALAIHIGGSKDGFVQLMNEKARALGMTHTSFTSVHGLPPSAGQDPDVTTARDLAILGRALAKFPEAFRYTSTQVRMFRNNTFEMRNHNKLLGAVEGVDGFKTGYYGAAGFTIVATAQRNGARVIAVVMGSATRQVRDAKAAELIAKGFLDIPRVDVPPPAVVTPAVTSAVTVGVSEDEEAIVGDEGESEAAREGGGGWGMFGLGLVVGAAGAFGLLAFLNRRPRDDKSDLLRR